MTSENGRNGSTAAVADMVPEPATDAPFPTAARHTIGPATRTGMRATEKFQQNRFVIIGAGALVVALLLFVAVSVPHSHTSQRPKAGVAGGQIKPSQSKSAPEQSLLPITDSARPAAKETHDGLVDEQDVQRTATRSPIAPKTARPSVAVQAGTLASIQPFPDQWQPPPYQPGADGNGQPADKGKAERDALEKSSLVYVRNVSGSQGNSSSTHSSTDPAPTIDLGLPIGTRLRAHLESALSTAVRTPVLAVIEYNYQREGEIVVPAGAKAVGHIQQADRSGYVTIQFDSLMMPDGAAVSIDGVATDLSLGPPKGKVVGKNTGKNVLVRSLSGIGEVGALLVGRGSLDQPLSEEDMLRERVSNNVGEASDEQVSRLALTEHVVVTIPANAPIYVVLEKTAISRAGSERTTSGSSQSAASENVDQLRQLLKLQQELQETAAINDEK
jgi:hypothetical protein